MARPVYNAQGNLLFAAGTILAEVHLERMARQGVRRVFIEDPLTEGIDPEEILSEATVARAVGLLADFLYGLEKIRQPSSRLVPYAELRRLAVEMRGDLEARRSPLAFPLETGQSEDFPVIHAVNVAILSLALARDLGLGSQEIDVAVGALLHDVGKQLHPDLVARLGGDADHSTLGFKFLGLNPEVGAMVRSIVAQHHERLDGSGQPHGLSAGQIFPLAQIVGLANAYDSMVTSSPGGTPQPPHVALEFIMAEAGWGYDVKLVERFSSILVPYPVGRVVRLSDGRVGMVYRVDLSHLARPMLRILEGDGAGTEIALTDPAEQSLVIVESLGR